ncbi:MAG: proton-conducting transporter membrane subunit, partial [Pseudonocardiaceae bacterium]
MTPDNGSALLLALLLVPLAGSVVVAPMRSSPAGAKAIAMAFALGEVVLAALAWWVYDPGGDRLQLTMSATWIPAFGARFALGVDGIALVMIALTAVLVPIVMGSSWEEKLPEGRTAAGLYSLLLASQSMMVGVFAATDVFLFYLFFEVMLVPMYFLIGRFGGPRRQYAAVKFFLYSLLGGLVML